MLDDSPPQRDTFRYLGLPGIDLLDLRFFHEKLCAPRNLKFRFLGFNNAAQPSSREQTELNISLDEVRRLDHVDPQSDVIGDDLRGIANPLSMAWKRTRDLAPYDVVNLDLCDGFGQDDPSDAGAPTYFRALNSLMSLQTRSTAPWLLLLTTRAGEHQIHAEVMRTFVATYEKNLSDCVPFKAASRALFDFDEVPAAVETRFLPLFLSGLCKWLLSVALGFNPPSRVDVRSVIGYRISPAAPHEDLISLAIRFSPVLAPVVDRMGLGHKTSTALDECELAVKAINRIAKMANADDILRADADLHAEMVEATATLLPARYDPEAYRAWVSAQATGS
jgi:hypothetical protein